MSTMAMAAFLLASPAANAAEPVTAEEAMAHYQEAFSLIAAGNCPATADPDEIVVCGRKDGQKERLPLPVQPEPGKPVRLVPGEMPSAEAAMNISDCSPSCQGFGIDIIGTAIKVVDGIDRLIHGD